MLAKRIIPCLDGKDGKTAKGINFVNLCEAGDPVELATVYSQQGADELVFLDITASHEGRKTFTEIVANVAANIDIPFTVGGGINELSDIERLLNAGADKRICFLNGGRIPTDKGLFEWAVEAEERGAGEILFTSMMHDGVKEGYSNEALAILADKLHIPVIASGGAGKMDHFYDAFTIGKADAALAASVFHFGEIIIPNLKQYLLSKNVNVRNTFRP